MQQGADSTMQQGADSTSQMDPASPSSGAMDMGANAQPQMQEIEVLEDKEGPDNQVIYKYQGANSIMSTVNNNSLLKLKNHS